MNEEKRYCEDCENELQYLPHNDCYNCKNCKQLYDGLATLTEQELQRKQKGLEEKCQEDI